MKAVILAAGKGVRLQPLTNDIPKPMIEINGKPFLYYVIKQVKKALPDSDIALVVGYKKEEIEDFVKSAGFSVSLIEQKEQSGTGHAVSVVKDFVGDESFVVAMGDNLYDASDISRITVDDDLCYIAGFRHANPENFGVLVADGNRLVRIIEKPKQRISDLINAGLYKFTPEIFGVLGQVKKSGRGEYELTDAITLLAHAGKVVVTEIETWLDLGNISDIQKIGDFLKNWEE